MSYLILKNKIFPKILCFLALSCFENSFAGDSMIPFREEPKNQLPSNFQPYGALPHIKNQKSYYDLPHIKEQIGNIYVGYKNINTESSGLLDQYKNLLDYKNLCLKELINNIYDIKNIKNIMEILYGEHGGVLCETEEGKNNFSVFLKEKALAAVDRAFNTGKSITFSKGMFHVMTTTLDNTHMSYFMQGGKNNSVMVKTDLCDERLDNFKNLSLKKDSIQKEADEIMNLFQTDIKIFPFLDCCYGSPMLKEELINDFKTPPFFDEKGLNFYDKKSSLVWRDPQPFVGLLKFLTNKFPASNKILNFKKDLEKEYNFLEKLLTPDYVTYIKMCNRKKEFIEPLSKLRDKIENSFSADTTPRKIGHLENEWEKSDNKIMNIEKEIKKSELKLGEYLSLLVYSSVVAKELSVKIKDVIVPKFASGDLRYNEKTSTFYLFFDTKDVPVASKIRTNDGDTKIGNAHFELFQCQDLEDRLLIDGCVSIAKFKEKVDVHSIIKDGFLANPNIENMKIFPEEIAVKN